MGQPFAAGNEWPQVNIVAYDAVVDYEAGAMQIDMVREQPQPEPMGGGVRFAGQQRTVQAVSGSSAWNRARSCFRCPIAIAGPDAAPGATAEAPKDNQYSGAPAATPGTTPIPTLIDRDT